MPDDQPQIITPTQSGAEPAGEPPAADRPITVGYEPAAPAPIDPIPQPTAPAAPAAPPEPPKPSPIAITVQDETGAPLPAVAPPVAQPIPDPVPAMPTPQPAAPTAAPIPSTPASPTSESALGLTPPVLDKETLQDKINNHPLFSGAKDRPFPKRRKAKKGLIWALIALLIIIVGGYLAIDSGLVRGASHLPFHIFKQAAPAPQPVINTQQTTSKSSQSSTTTDPYAGWQSFCSDYAGLCIKYPSGWKLSTDSVPSQTENNVNVTAANLTSPSGSLILDFTPSATYPLSTPPGTFSTNVLSIDNAASTSDFKVVKAVQSWTYNGQTTISSDYYVTTPQAISDNKVVSGQTSTSESNAEFFVNTKTNHQNTTTHQDNFVSIIVGLASTKDKGIYANFDTTQAAQAWFDSAEVKVAGQILSSVSYKQ